MEKKFEKKSDNSFFMKEKSDSSFREERKSQNENSDAVEFKRRSYNPNFDEDNRPKGGSFNRNEDRKGSSGKREPIYSCNQDQVKYNSDVAMRPRRPRIRKEDGGAVSSFSSRGSSSNSDRSSSFGEKMTPFTRQSRDENSRDGGQSNFSESRQRSSSPFGSRDSSIDNNRGRDDKFSPFERGGDRTLPYQRRREGDFQPSNRGERASLGYSGRRENSGSFNRGEDSSYNRNERFNRGESGTTYNRSEGVNSYNNRGERSSYNRSEGVSSYNRNENSSYNRNENRSYNRSENSSYGRRDNSSYNRRDGEQQYQRKEQNSNRFSGDKTNTVRPNRVAKERSKYGESSYSKDKRVKNKKFKSSQPFSAEPVIEGEIRLNRYVAMSGVCSRREADELIAAGEIMVNGEIIKTLGAKVTAEDVITRNGVVLKGEKLVYIVMNKPKNVVTTVDDPNAEKTVIDLLQDKVKERVFPVGRLDKNSLGVILLTNDGELTKELTHPSFEKKKIYHVFLDKPVKDDDMEQLAQGVELEDGLIYADELSYVEDNLREVGIEIHSGRNRIVRRMFEHLGYQVLKLDRVYFAGITKKNLKRGFWRYLTAQEVGQLKNRSTK